MSCQTATNCFFTGEREVGGISVGPERCLTVCGFLGHCKTTAQWAGLVFKDVNSASVSVSILTATAAPTERMEQDGGGEWGNQGLRGVCFQDEFFRCGANHTGVRNYEFWLHMAFTYIFFPATQQNEFCFTLPFLQFLLIHMLTYSKVTFLFFKNICLFWTQAPKPLRNTLKKDLAFVSVHVAKRSSSRGC